MKTTSLALIVLGCACSCFGQGSIQFNNRVTGTTTAAVVAPIYGPDPSDPLGRKNGNAATGPTTPIPTGTQAYAGQPLVGTGYTASLWARVAGTSDPFVLAATTPFRNTTSTSLFGFWTVPGTAVILPNVPSDPGVRAEITIRVWDNRGGTVTTWEQAVALDNYPTYVATGESLAFTVSDQLGGGVVLPPTLRGLQSFQLYAVPEPSTIALFLLSAAAFCIGHHRRHHR